MLHILHSHFAHPGTIGCNLDQQYWEPRSTVEAASIHCKPWSNTMRMRSQQEDAYRL